MKKTLLMTALLGTSLFAFELGHLVKNKKEPILLYCAHASRSKSLGEGLKQMGFKNVYELKGGIENGWIKSGKKTVK